MFRLIVAIVSLGVCSLAGAQVTSLADVKAKNGVQLSAEELKQLMPGAKVIGRTQAGSTWRVADNGRLCVKINWNVSPDDWCRVMFKVGDKYYGVGRLDDNAPASEFEILK
jgi:hypothetical protein